MASAPSWRDGKFVWFMSAVVRLESHGFADALVRSQKNTKGDATEVTLAPICEGAEGRCGAGQIVAVPFNTRSYFQRSYGGTCDATPFGTSDYSCVDYGAGGIVFSGRSLTFEVDLSGDGCGCNAALYLVSMPQSHNESQCHDFYCDANNVCGVRCDEIDLMEANTVAWVSTVHVGDDGAGEGFGYAHYVFPQEKRLRSPTHDCAYGPSPECAVNTLYPFGATSLSRLRKRSLATGSSFHRSGAQRRSGLCGTLAIRSKAASLARTRPTHSCARASTQV